MPPGATSVRLRTACVVVTVALAAPPLSPLAVGESGGTSTPASPPPNATTYGPPAAAAHRHVPGADVREPRERRLHLRGARVVRQRIGRVGPARAAAGSCARSVNVPPVASTLSSCVVLVGWRSHR